MSFADMVGLVGVSAYLVAYGLLQTRILGVGDGWYAALNALGGVALIYSLWTNFNLSSFIAQVLWLAFTIIGWVRSRHGAAQRA
ncbi:cyclic nucleotide-binding protein [Pseudoxanthobacter sp.]|uniref:CBU_0592 family membrane protein n=1 Tax=Pseudoxanthobacter sp. TaxID=1925742 RepID=UPI002FE33C17